MAASTAPPALAAAAAPSARRALLINGIKFSVAMSGLEGCVVATIALSAAVVPPALAHTANAMLSLFFAIKSLFELGIEIVKAQSSENSLELVFVGD